ncbi:MAG: osmotically inducible protein OsmC [Betaproteobacteria bacterium RIFCSPLOWO2_12_FULL_63_13]|nr:MAG: osmotically inducible protein OsmC [Betaproteobacteria bacterium RIFCSPLOWO2_02_FULL_63_19]OGA43211.1 MAG: osmotically inducible protein OsmC [Betaproteobacteria bacterium RIFCSPLOWO2_12_FULL_63_13]
MQDLPHHYRVAASAQPEGDVNLTSDRLAAIPSAAPVEFGGPGNRWSPETLLTAAVADCFILSFRAIAKASKLSWVSLQCTCEGTLERVDGTTKFTQFAINATLEAPQGTNEERAHRLLEKAEASCLVTRSLSGPTHLNAVVSVKPQGAI